ncbi:MAG: phytoene desaturase family protein [Tepidisphaerales bacterium]
MAHAIVVGAGFGGIAAALRLRAKGYAVTLIDKQDKLGGRAYQYRTPGGFTHDAGPTVVTAHFLFDELFALFGKRRDDYVRFVDLYPWYRIRFADGSAFDYGGTLEQMEAQIEAFEPGGKAGFRAYLEHSRRIFDTGFTKLGAVPFHDPLQMLKCAPDLLRLKNYLTVWQMAGRYFKTEKLRRVFSFQPLLVGGNPFNTTSIYSLIFYLEREWGVQFAMGGTGAIVSALQRLLVEEGVQIRLGEEVCRIDVADSGRVRGVEVRETAAAPSAAPERLPADLVVCNADAPHVYTHLLDRRWARGIAPRRVHARRLPLKYSMGLFVLYFGTTRLYPDVAHHTIVLGNSYKELIYRIFDRFEVETEDLSVYLHRPTATDPSMAPPGCESFYVLVPVPNLQGGHDWSTLGPRLRDATVRYLERTELPGLSRCIVEDFYVTPEHFAKNLNSLHGAGFSIQPLFSQSAYFRFHNKAPGVDGLYFVGAATHPGAGMPGVLCSAKVLEHLVPTVGQPRPAAAR